MIDFLRERLGCPDLNFHIDPDWGSDNRDGRARLRAAISHDAQFDASDLNTPPESASFAISISHTLGLGGYVIAPRPFAVGLDIEIFARIREPIVRRVSSRAEIESAPDLAFLWTAKEAVFKSLLGPDQPRVLSVITIDGWQKVSHSVGLESKIKSAFEFRSRGGQGVVFRDEKFAFAVFCRSPST